VLGGKAGLVAALLAAVSPVLVYYSQETRMYGLVTLFAAASVYWTVRLYRKPRSTSTRVAYILATLAAIYTHYYAFFVVLAENLFVCLALLLRRRWRVLGGWLATQAVLVVAYLPWIVVQSAFLSGKASTRFEEWDLATWMRIAGETLFSFGAGLAVSPTISWVAVVLFLVVIAAGMLALLRRRQTEPWLIVAYLLTPLFLAWLVNPIMPFFYPRYLLLIAPAFYVLAGWGVVALGHLWRPLAAIGGAVLLLASVFGLRGYYTDETYVKGRYGQMMAYIEANAQPGDGLLLANQLQRPIFEYYRPLELDARFFPGYEYALEDPRTADDLQALAARHPRLWFVRYGNPAEYDPDGYLTRWLATHGSKAYFDGWGDADLSLYVMEPASGEASAGGIEHPLRAELDEQVVLLGYAVSAKEVVPGETLLLTLYWKALKPITERYTVFTHLLDTGDLIRAQMDGEPQGGGLPTDRWEVGEIVQDNYALVVESGAMPGPHVLEVGMYLLETLERLPVRDPESGEALGDRVVLGTIQVVD
jgi:hypothetical protein